MRSCDVAGRASGAAEDLTADDQRPAEISHPTEIEDHRVGRQAQFDPGGVQSGEVSVVGQADPDRVPVGVGDDLVDHGSEREVLPAKPRRASDQASVARHVAGDADLDGKQLLVGRQPPSWAASTGPSRSAAAGPESRAATSIVSCPISRPPIVDGAEAQPVEIQLDADRHQGSPSRAIGRARSARRRAPDRVELADQSPGPQLADQVGHRGDPEAAAGGDVVAAARAVVADVAQDAGQVFLGADHRAAAPAHPEGGPSR